MATVELAEGALKMLLLIAQSCEDDYTPQGYLTTSEPSHEMILSFSCMQISSHSG